ncbi:unnamed protein product [Medioppia subpectinata]|uniref:ABC transmembrane type-1 domain-containing protein n=1 Tax=Medioppia subpectinata TaxID=1979941 RepID=A0A7R9KIB5_9ACAR|nr:unnamed protein product [Medioppia subpectinata]CAG2104027.1 unnamed protein product [Medioppia subpectinata]
MLMCAERMNTCRGTVYALTLCISNVIIIEIMDVANGLVTIPSPWDRINIFSKLTFSWVWSLFIRAHKKNLEFSDLYRCPKSDETHLVRHKLQIEWDNQLKSKGKPSLYKALIASFGPELIILYMPDAIKELGLQCLQAYCIVYLVRYFNKDPNTSQWRAIWAAVGIMLAALINMFITNVNGTLNCKVGVRIRAACCALIYRKSMRLSHSSLGKTTVGQILNIMSNDVNRFDEGLFLYGNPAWPLS